MRTSGSKGLRAGLRAFVATAGLFLLWSGLSGQAQALEPVPEIDAGSLTSALTLLTGGLLLLSGRPRRS